MKHFVVIVAVIFGAGSLTYFGTSAIIRLLGDFLYRIDISRLEFLHHAHASDYLVHTGIFVSVLLYSTLIALVWLFVGKRLA